MVSFSEVRKESGIRRSRSSSDHGACAHVQQQQQQARSWITTTGSTSSGGNYAIGSSGVDFCVFQAEGEEEEYFLY